MSTINWNEVRNQAKQWVLEAGKEIRASFQRKLSINFKTDASDLVTNMDKQTEQFFISKINETYPEHKILGEEGYGDRLTTMDGTVWVIDPIDGTMNFVHMQRHFAISIGIYHNGEGKVGMIYDVTNDELFHAIKGEGAFLNEKPLPKLSEVEVEEAVISCNASWVANETRLRPHILPEVVQSVRGVRSFGSAAMEMAYVASGFIDGYITLRLAPWDFAAGKVLVEEVGGKITTITGKELPLLESSTVFVAKSDLHEKLMDRYFMRVEEI